MSTPPENLLEVDALKVHFPIYSGFLFKKITGLIKAVDGTSFSIKKGEVLGLVGESGCGKSTLARAIMQLQPISSGEVHLGGTCLNCLHQSRLRRKRNLFQMVFQDPFASLNPRMTVFSALSEALQTNRQYKKLSKAQLREEVALLMSKVGLNANDMLKYPHEFSGGQRQRIAIARALAPRPQLIIADEPVSALDVSVQSQIINLIKQLSRDMGLTILFISHDLSVVKYISDRIAVMYLGKIVEIGKATDIIEKPLHPYTKALVSAITIPDPKRERSRQRIMLTGELPSRKNLPQGCPFHPRCPYAIERCKQIIPPLESPSTSMHPVACIRATEINPAL
jgi:oligopeptide transport system ATP-binding protein